MTKLEKILVTSKLTRDLFTLYKKLTCQKAKEIPVEE